MSTTVKESYFKIPAVSNSLMGEVKRNLLGLPALNSYSPALREGSTMHKLILEREKFNIYDYTGRERMKAMKLDYAIKSAVPPDHLLGEKEVGFMYEFRGWMCKMKIDIIDRERKVVTDLKSTRCTTQEEFIGSIIEYDYWRQGAWYLDAPPIVEYGINTFRIIAICKTEPYPVFIWNVDRDDPRLNDGREDYESILSHMEDDPKYQDRKAKSYILDDTLLDQSIYIDRSKMKEFSPGDASKIKFISSTNNPIQ